MQIVVFQTYGTTNHLYIRGRAIEDENIDLEAKGVFKLFINAWKRFETDELRHVELKCSIGADKVFYTTTDRHGYFLINENVENLSKYANTLGWVKFKMSYNTHDLKRNIQSDNIFLGEILIPPKTASFGVISDIDDTILHTGLVSTLKWRVLINTIFTSAGKRLPLEGAPEFYHKLHRGVKNNERNPIFYVSHSPWNLYRYLTFFLKKNNFPKGPIILRNFPLALTSPKPKEKPQKQKEIVNILKTYPYLKLVLIGDSGEHDPDIYLEIAKTYPTRIAAIYLRSVNHHKKMLRVQELYKAYSTIPILFVEDSAQAITHARAHNFIS